MKPCYLVLLCLPLMLVACSNRTAPDRRTAKLARTAQGRWYTPAQVRQGAAVFRKDCASCHGARAQGAPGWPRRGSDGRVPAPPLNGTAHAWVHPLSYLRYLIAHGSPLGHGRMPAWKGRLTRAQMDATIAWFQAWWPEPVYRRWLLIERRARRARR